MKTKSVLIMLNLFLACTLQAQIKVNQSGDVGIGTSTPSREFQVNGHSRFFAEWSAHTTIYLGSETNDAIIVDNSPNNYYGGGYFFRVHNESALYDYTDVMMLTDNGYVGIGTRTPSYKLDVYGDIATYGTLRISSDKRLKKEIKSINNSIERLKLLDGVSYLKEIPEDSVILLAEDKDKKISNDLKEKKKTQSEMGFIAQDLQKVFPDLVSKDSKGYLTIDYISLIPVVVEALKQQQTIIEEQDNRIKEIEKLLSIGEELPKSKSAVISSNLETKSTLSNTVLYQNTPNPFKESTEIKYFLPTETSRAMLYIYDLNGKQLKTYPLTGHGTNSLTIHGGELYAGLFTYALIINGVLVDSKKMVLTE